MSKDTEPIYNRIVQIVSKFDRRSFAIALIEQIRLLEEDRIPIEKMQIWNLLFLLKICVVHGGFNPRKQIKFMDILNLHNLCLELNSFVPAYESESNKQILNKIMRRFAFQQFGCQQELSLPEIERTIKLLKLSERTLEKNFSNDVNFSYKDFLKYVIIIYAWHQTHLDIPILDISDIKVAIEDKEIFDQITSYLSRDISYIQKDILQDAKARSKRLEIFDQSILYKYPIWEIKGAKYLISKHLFEKAMTRLPIEKAFIKNPAGISKAFETYTHSLLKRKFNSFLNEKEIEKRYQLKEGQKKADFLVFESLGKVTIECKAIYAPKLSKVDLKLEILISSYKESILKGLVQSIETHFYLDTVIFKNNFMLIVTLDDLNFSWFEEVYDEFIREGLERNYPGFEEKINNFNLSHIFILPISTFESIIYYICKENIEFASLLLKLIKYREEVGDSNYFDFADLFDSFMKKEHGENYKIEYEKNETELLFEEIRNSLTQALSHRK
ncbi:hypothetical protein EHQ43_10155 [Leptospira bouyouniensis]|uniref:Uncharacterized protein n=1 Tax=Leptospira bouyouniensis TaxID=2484911 RepID=A0A7I0HRX7_9LEPT|nr:hypothetical protein [Leptospira bouyouniensis]TGL04997.1 hypothetical protein EHQ43_10155 [Leptospira bouyouniensis]